MMKAPKMLAIIAVALHLQSYRTKVLLVQTHDGTDNAPEESIKTKSRVASQIKTSKLKTKAGHQSIQNKALGLPTDLLPGTIADCVLSPCSLPTEKPGRQIIVYPLSTNLQLHPQANTTK